MRFMMIMYPGPKAETGAMPEPELLEAMMKYNEELVKAGAMLGGEGLHPTSRGARVRFQGGKPVVTDGPFTESKEIVGGYWMIQAKSKEEAIEWARRAPCPDGEMIEIRQVFEPADFGPEIEKRETELIQEIAKQHKA